jgi:putative flippase GtrA
MRIYFVLLRFVISSLIAAGIDFVVFAIVFAATSSLLTSVIAGRVSSLANFALNRRFVFKSGAGITLAVLKYYLLAIAVGAAAYFSIKFMAGTLGVNVLAAKIVAETALWFASFSIQRTLVFGPKQPRRL